MKSSSIYTLNFLLVFFIILLHSCEYDNKDLNYNEITRPNENVTVNINLAEISKGQTIYVYTETSFKYDINVSSGTIVSKEFYLDNKPIKPINGTIVLAPKMLEGRNLGELKIKLKLSSGTGSLANLLGEETTDIEIKFPVKYVNPKIGLNIDQRVNSDGQLEIFWKKPILEGAEVESYTIYSRKANTPNNSLEIIATITDPNQTSYTDKDYAYGVKPYKIETKYKSNRVPIGEDLYYVKYESLTEKMFTTSSTEPFKLKIKWQNPNPFASKYVLKFKDEILYVNPGTTEVSVKRPLFPAISDYYELYILPKESNFIDYQQYAKVIAYYSDRKFDDILRYDFFADLKNNIILGWYSDKQNGFRLFDKNDLNIKNDIIFADRISGKLRVSSKTGKIGFISDKYPSGKFYFYSDLTLTKLISTFLIAPANIRDFFITNDDKLLINYTWPSSQTMIYDANTGKLLNIVREDGKIFQSALSYDGLFLINYGGLNNKSPWYKIYKYNSDNTLTLLKNQMESPVADVYFHPLKHNQVVIQYIGSSDNDFRQHFTIYELPNMNKITSVTGQFRSFDKFTGNSLYEYYAGQTRILNASYDKTIYALDLNSPNYATPLLINGYIILEGKYFDDITK